MTDKSQLPPLTVIIPTYNRVNLLSKALAGYLVQTAPQLIHELLVVDDGSTDSTEEMVRDYSVRSPFSVRYLRQPNKGPAAARNLGIREARSELVLFSDSDIVPAPNLVEQHSVVHQQNQQDSTAVLGYVTWAPQVHPTPFMHWYGEDGILFAYRRARGSRTLDFHFFYTCNLSAKVRFLRTYGQFDETFKSAAYEDTELGYRLSKHNLRLLYNPGAIGYHYQFFSFEDACRKARANAAAARHFFETEAGQQSLSEIQQKRSGTMYKLGREIAKGAAFCLSPAKACIDSRIPLPWSLYRLFYWYAINRDNDIAAEFLTEEAA